MDRVDVQEAAIDQEEPAEEHGIIRATEVLPEDIYILPLTSRPYFPGIPIPLMVDRPEVQNTLKWLLENKHHTVGLLLQKHSASNVPLENFYNVGVVAKIVRVFADESTAVVHLLLNCLERFKVKEFHQTPN